MITYVDKSVLLELLVDDDVRRDAAQRLWLESDFVVCAEIGYVEARAARAAARRGGRLATAQTELGERLDRFNRLLLRLRACPLGMLAVRRGRPAPSGDLKR